MIRYVNDFFQETAYRMGAFFDRPGKLTTPAHGNALQAVFTAPEADFLADR